MNIYVKQAIYECTYYYYKLVHVWMYQIFIKGSLWIYKNTNAYRAVIDVVDDIKHDLMSLCLPLVLINMTENRNPLYYEVLPINLEIELCYKQKTFPFKDMLHFENTTFLSAGKKLKNMILVAIDNIFYLRHDFFQ